MKGYNSPGLTGFPGIQVGSSKGKVVKKNLTLVDRGRGLQLSTHRVTVQDLVPYFQEGCSHEEILRWIPTLTHDEISFVKNYYREHKHELDEVPVFTIRAAAEKQRLRSRDHRGPFGYLLEQENIRGTGRLFLA